MSGSGCQNLAVSIDGDNVVEYGFCSIQLDAVQLFILSGVDI